MPINCKQPNVYQCGKSWTTESNELPHPMCGMSYHFFEHKVSRNIIVIAAAPADSHGDHTAQFVAASQGGGGQLRVNFCLQARDITLVIS